jgi:tetratricopeptide (TPR) repeat protein
MALNREAVVASAEKMVARGKIDGAIKEYRKLVADNPGDAMTINRLGDLYVRINKNEEAVKLFLQIADRYTEDGFFVKAIAIFKKIIKLDPTRLPVYEHLAELYHKQGLVTEARTQYQVLVDYYLKHGKIDSAEGVLRKMTALDSGDPTPHVKLAEIYRDRGEHDKELHEYRLLAEMMLRHKRIEEAAQVYAKAIAAAPHDLGFITDAVLGLKDAGQPAAAAKLLGIAVERNPQAEKIARIAGIGDRRKLEQTGVHRIEADGVRVLKVSDVAPVPPELRATAPPRPEPPKVETSKTDTPRPSFLLEEIELEFPAADRAAAQGRGAEALTKPPVEPWLPPGADDAELEFVLEIEGEEAPAAPAEPEPKAASAPAASAPAAPPAQLLPDIDWAFEPEPALELELELPAGGEPEAPAPPAPPPAAAPPAPAPPAKPEAPRPAAAAPAIAPPKPPAPERPVTATIPVQVPLPKPEAPAIAALAPKAFAVAPAPPAPAPLPAARRHADLLAEAEVFRRHGLIEKAHDRLRSILAEDAKHPGALALATLVLLDEGKLERAFARAQQLERLAPGAPAAAESWDGLRPKLERAGFRFEKGKLAAAPEPKKPKKDSISVLLQELAGVAPRRPAAEPAKAAAPPAPPVPKAPPARAAPPPPAPVVAAAAPPAAPKKPPVEEKLLPLLAPPKPAAPPKKAPARPAPDLAALVDDLAATVKAKPAAPAKAAPPRVEAPPAARPPAPAAPPIAASAAPPAAPPAPKPAAPPAPAPPVAPPPAAAPPRAAAGFDTLDEVIDDKLSWLDEAAARAAAKPPAAPPSAKKPADDLFADEEGFFDLAAELEAELSKEELGGKMAREEPSLEEIVEGFKKGVAESLSPEDYDTHFNLGIAYREMGLLDEAIGEFQLAAKHPNYLLDCCTLLGGCFLEKGLPELAVKWYQRGLSTPNLTEEANLGLLYDLGNLYFATGDNDRARRTFVELYGINSNYRDVVAKLEELGSRS